MVHDLQDLRLVQARHGLGPLVVVHQHHPLAPGAQQVEAGEGAHHMLVLIQDGVGPEAALQHGVADVVHVVVQVEADQVLALADAGDGQGVADEPHRPVGVQRRGDEAAAALHGQQLRGHLRLADDDAADADLQGPADHVRLVAADHDAVRPGEDEVFAARRQGDGDLAGDLVGVLAPGVEDAPLQHGEEVVDRNVVDVGLLDGGDIKVGHVPGGEHAVEGAVVIGHRHDGDAVRLHGGPGPADGGGGGEGHGGVVVQVPDLGADVAEPGRGLRVEALQHGFGLVADLAQAGGLVLPQAQGVLQRGVGHGGDDGVRVGILVAGDINGIHRSHAPSGVWPDLQDDELLGGQGDVLAAVLPQNDDVLDADA